MEQQTAEDTLPCRSPDPAQPRPANQELHVRAELAKKRGRFESTLPTPDDEHAPFRESTEVGVLARMTHKVGVHSRELERPHGEIGDAGRNDDALALNRVAVIEREVVTVAHALDLGHLPRIRLR
jgi:hypothetical protein